MPVQRNRFPDYFGTARSVEPVAGNLRLQVDERGDAGQDDDSYAGQSAYPSQSSMGTTSSFRPNQWASSGTQQRASRSTAQGLQNLQQFAYGGTNARPAATRPQAPRSQAARLQTRSTYGQPDTPRRAQPAPWSNRGQPVDLSYDQPGTRINWSRRPDGGYYSGMRGFQMPDTEEDDDVDENEVTAAQIYAPMKRYTGKRQTALYNAETQSARRQARHAGPTYDTQHRPQNSWTPRSAQPVQPAQPTHCDWPLPPTPRASSSSSLTRNPIQPVHRPAPRIHGIELVSPRASLDSRFHSVFPYEHFNAMQSSCFPSVYGSNDNIVVASPTGSGKTAIFELAVCRLLTQRDREKQDFKIVYQAPTKALCSERARDWQAKFSKSPLVSALGKLQVAEFTGDSSAFEVRRVRTASIIVTTPEKWDSITRKWSDHVNNALLRSVKLVLIDEVHILKDSRGATLETVVSRMKTLGNDVRFVALSATIPNSKDIAQWLGLTHTMPHVPARTFVFGEEFRPVQLQKIVLGFNVCSGGNNGGNSGGGNEHTLDNMLDDQLPDLIVKHAQGKPVLIFCFSRKSTESAATALAEFWVSCPPHQRPWPAPLVSMRSNAPKLQATIASGVAFHHGGLERQDREMVEDAFLKGHMSIICCTSTLAVGVNLPCHTVILKGTMGYQSGQFAEYDEFELMQMIGRAGRPQFDTSATAIILTRAENRNKYLNLESGRQTVESTLHLNLIEHLNSEIVLGTITSLSTAIHWLRGTFLAVRLHENPHHYYQLANAGANSRTTDQQLEEICKVGIARLAEVGLLQYIDDGGNEDNAAGMERACNSKFHGTEYGSAMSAYMVRFETMVQIVAFEQRMSIEQLLNAMCYAVEFHDMRIKSTERPILRELNTAEGDNIPFRFKDNITETWQKVSLLIQVELSRGTLPYQHGRFSFEARHAMEQMQRLLECYIVCTIADRNGHNTRIALDLLRSISARAWEGDHHPAQLCQVPDIGPVNMRKLVDKKVTTVRQLAGLGPVTIERLLSKNPPAAMKIADTLKSFPMLAMEGQVSRCSSGNGKAVAQVTVAFANEGGPPRWRNRVPALTFLAATAEGALLHIWRDKLQASRLEHEMSFSVSPDAADMVLCYVACDEIVGALVSAQLSVVDVLPSDMQAISHFVKPIKPAKAPLVQSNQAVEAGNPAKRQKIQRTASESFDSVDLSNSYHASGSAPRRVKAPPLLRDNSFAFQSLSAKHPRQCRGGGTQTDPFTLDSGSDIDDFDSDIFDDLDLPVVDIASVNKTHSSSSISTKKKTIPTIKGSPLAIKDAMAPPAKPKDAAKTSPKFKPRSKPPLQLKQGQKERDKQKQKLPISVKPAESFARQKFVIPSIFENPGRDTSEGEDKGAAGMNGLEIEASPSEDAIPALCVVEGTPEGEEVEVQGTPEVEVAHTLAVEDVIQKDTCGEAVEEEKESSAPEIAQPPKEPPRQDEPGWVSAASNSSVIEFLRGHVKFV